MHRSACNSVILVHTHQRIGDNFSSAPKAEKLKMPPNTAPPIHAVHPRANPSIVQGTLESLRRLIAVWPYDVASGDDPAAMDRLLRQLRKALRAERQRGIAGHWAYDLARHAELLAAYRTLAAAHNAANLRQQPQTKEKRPRFNTRPLPDR